MALDPYALCPCGSGKKLKFCCSDLMSEMEKVQRMLEGDQPVACLAHIKQVSTQHPNRPSLLGLQAMLEIDLEQFDAARVTVDQFLKLAPLSPVANAELALLLARTEGGKAAIGALQTALEGVQRDMPRRVYEAIGAVGQSLLAEGEIFAARAHLLLQAGIGGADDQRAMSILMRLYQAPQVPLLLKDELHLAAPPKGAVWQEALASAMEDGAHGAWRRAAEKLEKLTATAGDAPQVWQNLALVRGWLGDANAAVAALRKYAALDVPLDDAVEAEALAQLLDAEARGRKIDVVRSTYEVRDMNQLEMALASDRRASRMAIDPAAFSAEDGPPPRHHFLILDRPLPTTGVGLAIDMAPQIVGQVAVYGRETDREPRLEFVGQGRESFETGKQIVNQIGGEALAAPAPDDVVTQLPDTQDTLGWNWRLPDDTPPKLRTELVHQKTRQVILERWPQLKRPELADKTPAEAAPAPELRKAVLGAILLLEQSSRVDRSVLDFNDLRRQLGLPTAEPIDPAGVNVRAIPIVRIERLMVERLSDDQLLDVFRRASLMGVDKALARLGHEMVRRDSLAGKVDRAEVFGMLAELESDPDKSIDYIDRARQAAEAAGKSSAMWDLAELTVQIERGDAAASQRLLNHIRSSHMREQGVAERLYEILVSFGIISPEGVPVGPAPDAAAGLAAVAPATAPAGALWTPEGAQPQAAQKSKLWVPGME